MKRWLYHLVEPTADVGDPYAPASLAKEGFIHCSYQPAVAESARLYFPADAQARLRVLQIDPRRLAVPVDEAATPRGPMPHVHGAIQRTAVVAVRSVEEMSLAPDLL